MGAEEVETEAGGPEPIEVEAETETEMETKERQKRLTDDACASVAFVLGGCFMCVFMIFVISWVSLMAFSEGVTPPGGQCDWWDVYCSETPGDADPLDYLSRARRQEVLNTRLYNVLEHGGEVYGAILSELNKPSAAKYNFTVTMMCVGLPPEELLIEETVEVRGGGYAEFRLSYDRELVTEYALPCGLYISGYLPYEGFQHIYYVYSEHIFYEHDLLTN